MLCCDLEGEERTGEGGERVILGSGFGVVFSRVGKREGVMARKVGEEKIREERWGKWRRVGGFLWGGAVSRIHSV